MFISMPIFCSPVRPLSASSDIHKYILYVIQTYFTYIHTYEDTYIHTCIHSYIHTCIHSYIHTYMHATYMHNWHSVFCMFIAMPIFGSPVQFLSVSSDIHTCTYILYVIHICIHTLCHTFLCMHTYMHTYIGKSRRKKTMY